MDEDMLIMEAKIADLAGQVLALQTLAQVLAATHPHAHQLGRVYGRAVQGVLDSTLPTLIMEQARDGVEHMRDRILLAIEQQPFTLVPVAVKGERS